MGKMSNPVASQQQQQQPAAASHHRPGRPTAGRRAAAVIMFAAAIRRSPVAATAAAAVRAAAAHRQCPFQLQRQLLHTTLVHVHCLPGSVEKVIAATLENCAASSSGEPGCIRFDLFQSEADPNMLIIEEMYRTQADAAAHKETAHYLAWREAVADCMAKGREGVGVKLLSPLREGGDGN
jgi:autoinducer 2-degrading protein